MKHQQNQLASKRNFIRIAALVVMLVLMVCGTVILAGADPVPESYTGSHDHLNIPNDEGFRMGENGKWVKTYDGTTGIGDRYLWVKVDGQSILADSVTFNSPNVGEATYITVAYTVDGVKYSKELPAEIRPAELTWNGEGTVTVPYNPADDSYTAKVDFNGATLVGLKGEDTVSYDKDSVEVSFVANDLKEGYAYAEVVPDPKNTNYVVAPLKVKYSVVPATIDTITWVGTNGSYTFGDDLAAIKAIGNDNVPMIVKVLIDGELKSLAEIALAGDYTLVAIAPNALYTIGEGVNVNASITVAKASYTLVFNGAEYVDSGDILNAGASFGYQLFVEGKDGAIIPEWILSAITYEYTDANGNVSNRATLPGVYTVKAIVPEFANANVVLENNTATLTVIANYRVIATPDGSMLIIGENGVPASVETTLTIPTELDRVTVRGLRLYKAYTLTINNANGLAFEVRIPVSAAFNADKNCYPLAVANLYIVDAEGNKVVASDRYSVELSADGFYYTVKGYTTEGAVTFLIAPEYDVPFWSSALGIAILVFIALILLVVIPLIVGLVLIRIETSGNNPVITVETLGILPEFEPVIIPDKIEDPDAVIEEGLDAKAEELYAEISVEIDDSDVDAEAAVAEAMAQLNEELADVDPMEDANAAADDLADQFALGLVDSVEANDFADYSADVENAVEEAMAENFNESADATDAIALVEEEEAPEVAEEASEDAAEDESDDDDDEDSDSFGGFGSMPLDYIDAIAEADRYAEMLEQESRGEVQLVTRYRRSYLSRLAQSQGSIQDYYNVIKNLLLSYKGVKSRISWNFESFNVGRTPLAKFNAKTRTLYVYIAYSPEELADSKYNFTDMSAKKKYAAVPVLIKIKGERKFKHALELITMLCEEKLQLPKKKVIEEIDYKMPFKTTEELVNEGIIKKMVAAIPVAPATPATDDVVIEEVPAEAVATEEVATEEVVVEALAEETPAEEVATEEVVVAPAEEVAE